MSKALAAGLAGLLALAALSACGPTERAGHGSVPSGSRATSTAAPTATRMTAVPISPTGPGGEPGVPPTTTGKPATVRVFGTVSDGVEPGCTLLTSDGVVYQLIWRHGTPVLRPKMEVEGTLQPGLLTTCQQGTPLVVDRVVSP